MEVVSISVEIRKCTLGMYCPYCRCIVRRCSNCAVDNMQLCGTPESALTPDSVALKTLCTLMTGPSSDMYIRLRAEARVLCNQILHYIQVSKFIQIPSFPYQATQLRLLN